MIFLRPRGTVCLPGADILTQSSGQRWFPWLVPLPPTTDHRQELTGPAGLPWKTSLSSPSGFGTTRGRPGTGRLGTGILDSFRQNVRVLRVLRAESRVTDKRGGSPALWSLDSPSCEYSGIRNTGRERQGKNMNGPETKGSFLPASVLTKVKTWASRSH